MSEDTVKLGNHQHRFTQGRLPEFLKEYREETGFVTLDSLMVHILSDVDCSVLQFSKTDVGKVFMLHVSKAGWSMRMWYFEEGSEMIDSFSWWNGSYFPMPLTSYFAEKWYALMCGKVWDMKVTEEWLEGLYNRVPELRESRKLDKCVGMVMYELFKSTLPSLTPTSKDYAHFDESKENGVYAETTVPVEQFFVPSKMRIMRECSRYATETLWLPMFELERLL